MLQDEALYSVEITRFSSGCYNGKKTLVLCTLLKLQGSQAVKSITLPAIWLCTLLKLQGSQAPALPPIFISSFVLC